MVYRIIAGVPQGRGNESAFYSFAERNKLRFRYTLKLSNTIGTVEYLHSIGVTTLFSALNPTKKR